MNRNIIILLSAATISLFPFGAYANQTSDNNAFKAGVEYFKSGDYGSAVGYLKQAVNGKYKNNSSAHYWYGSALLKENRIDDALISFAEAYGLAPHTSVGANALKTLKYYKQRIKQSKSLNSFVQRKLQTEHPSTTYQPEMIAPTIEATDEDKVDQSKLRAIKRELRPVRKHVRSGPTLNQFSAWPITQKANYVYAGAFQAVSKAQSNVASAKQQLREAKARASKLVPTFRSYGDSESQFKTRIDSAKKVYDQLILPYQKEVENCKKQLNEAISIKNQAEQSLNTPLYYNPYGGRLLR